MASGWDKVFQSPSTCLKTTPAREMGFYRVDLDDELTIIFQNCKEERMRVIVHTIEARKKIHFSNQEFEEFLSTLSCFDDHWPKNFAIIGQYTLVFHHNGGERSLKFKEAFTDKYLFRWTEKILRLFCPQINELYKLNSKWFS